METAERFDFAQLTQDLAMSHVNMLKVGMEAGNRKVEAILKAYDRAQQDPNFKCPSYLMAAIEASR